jgi:hypothetical protein
VLYSCHAVWPFRHKKSLIVTGEVTVLPSVDRGAVSNMGQEYKVMEN